MGSRSQRSPDAEERGWGVAVPGAALAAVTGVLALGSSLNRRLLLEAVLAADDARRRASIGDERRRGATCPGGNKSSVSAAEDVKACKEKKKG